MRLLALTMLFFIGTTTIAFNQSSERFIRIVGNAKKTVQSTGIRVKIDLTELERNEYQKIREKSIEETKQDLAEPLQSMGYDLSDLKEVFPPPRRTYNNTKIEKYTIDVKSEDEAKEIFKFDIKGFKPTGITYIYPEENRY